MSTNFLLYLAAAICFFIAVLEGVFGKKASSIPWVALGLLLWVLVPLIAAAPST